MVTRNFGSGLNEKMANAIKATTALLKTKIYPCYLEIEFGRLGCAIKKSDNQNHTPKEIFPSCLGLEKIIK